MLYIFVALVTVIFLIWKGPVLVRVDKEISTVRLINYLQWDNLISSFSEFAAVFRAKAFFFILSLFSYIFPVTIKSIFYVNVFLFFLQAITFYFILNFLLKNKIIIFFLSLLFLLHPNNLLLGSAPDYVFAGQVFGVFSHFALLLFFKHKDKKILIWSFCLLFFSILLRVEMIFWLPVYFLLFYRLLEKEEIMKLKNTVNIFLVILFPLVFVTIMSFFVNPIGTLLAKKIFSYEISNGSTLILQIKDYYKSIFLYNFNFNIKYMYSSVPLILILIPACYLYKKREVQNYIFYALFFFFVITTLHCNERIDSFNYLSYIITPLIILFGIVIDRLVENKKNLTIVGVILIITFGYLNFIKYNPAWVNQDPHSILWNKEYKILDKNISKIQNNSAVILNNENSLIVAILDKRNMQNNNILVVDARKDLVGQYNRLSGVYKNIYISEGTMGYFRNDMATFFRNSELKLLVEENFNYEPIFNETFKRPSEYSHNVFDLSDEVNIFLYKLTSIKKK